MAGYVTGDVIEIGGHKFHVTVEKLTDICRREAEKQDAMPQSEPLEDPVAVLDDEAGFRAWAADRGDDLYTMFRMWFQERTGILVCAEFLDGFGYRPKHLRDERGVWRSWGKYPKWFTRMLQARDAK